MADSTPVIVTQNKKLEGTMAKLDMTGFVYRDGNKVVFTGALGKVEMIYNAARKDETFEFITGNAEEIPSHFTAYLTTDDGKTVITSAEGLTEDSALANLYAERAKFIALGDLGRI